MRSGSCPDDKDSIMRPPIFIRNVEHDIYHHHGSFETFVRCKSACELTGIDHKTSAARMRGDGWSGELRTGIGIVDRCPPNIVIKQGSPSKAVVFLASCWQGGGHAHEIYYNVSWSPIRDILYIRNRTKKIVWYVDWLLAGRRRRKTPSSCHMSSTFWSTKSSVSSIMSATPWMSSSILFLCSKLNAFKSAAKSASVYGLADSSFPDDDDVARILCLFSQWEWAAAGGTHSNPASSQYWLKDTFIPVCGLSVCLWVWKGYSLCATGNPEVSLVELSKNGVPFYVLLGRSPSPTALSVVLLWTSNLSGK